jgi:mono/diheme cytochrome c family protein
MRYRETNVGVSRRARALTPAIRRPIGYARRLFRRRESVSCWCQRPNQSLVPPCRTSTSASHLPVALDVGHASRRRNEGTARMVPRNDRGAGLVPGDMSQDWDRRCTRARLRALSFAVMIAVLVGCATGQPAAKPSASCAGPPATYVADVRPLLERRCFACHANDGVAAEDHDFSRVETLRAQRQSLTDEVAERAMPPKGRPQLTDSEAQLLLRWAACGAAER